MPTFPAEVLRDGKTVKFDAPDVWAQAKTKLAGKRVEITLEREYTRRTSPQNRRFFAMLAVCREVLNQKLQEAGSLMILSKDDVHELIDRNFLGTEMTPLGPVRKHCSKLDTAAMGRLMDEVEGFFRREYGAEFPDYETVMEASA